MKKVKPVLKVLLTVILVVFVFGALSINIYAEENTLFEAHYFIPGNGEEPVVLPVVSVEDLKNTEYTLLTFELSPEDCVKYFEVMEERNSVEFQLRYTGIAEAYVNRIAWGFKDDIKSDFSGDDLKKFVWESDEKVVHSDLKISDEEIDEDYLKWNDEEKAFNFLESEDDYDELIRKNALWGMEVGDVKGSGKTVVLLVSVKLAGEIPTQKTEPSNPTEESTMTPTTAPTEALSTATPTVEATPTATELETNTEDNNSGDVLVYIILGIVVCAIIAGIGIYVWKKKNK